MIACLQLGNAVDIGVLGLAGLDGVDRRQLDVGGGVEIGLAGAKADDVAAGRFERACFIRDRDGRGRLHTVERSGQERHHHLLANVVNTCSNPRLYLLGSRHPKARHAASQEAWPEWRQTLGNVKRRAARFGATFIKFCGEMTYIWQGLRSGQWLTPARARGYSLILLGVCAIAVAGWLALSDGLIDRNGSPPAPALF